MANTRWHRPEAMSAPVSRRLASVQKAQAPSTVKPGTYSSNMQLETDDKFRRPGVVLLITGVVALVLRLVVDGIPWIGGLLSWVCLLGGIFFIIGGIFLLIKKSGT